MKVYRGYGDGSVTVQVDGGKERALPLRLDLWNHSPTGFCWGYSGSGPAQLALALLADLLPDEPEKAVILRHRLKDNVIARLPQLEPWELSDADVLNALRVAEVECFEWAWSRLVASGGVQGDVATEYERVKAAWEAAGRPIPNELYVWIVEEAHRDPHTWVV